METHRLRRSFTSSCFSASSQRKVVRNCVAIPASAAGPPLSPAHAAAAATPPLKSPDTLPAQHFTIPQTGLWHVSRVPLKRPDRKSVVQGKSVSERVDLGGRRLIKKKKKKKK